MRSNNIFCRIMMISGAVMISAAFSLIIYNRHESTEAGIKSEHMVSRIISEESIWNNTEQSENQTYQYVAEDGLNFFGIISIPVLDIRLPVCSDFSMENLSSYPCIYSGDISDSNMIIAAHNYDSHFGNIKSLDPGDTVILKTVSGKEIVYEVFSTDIIPGDKSDEMISGDWDLTLFTCNRSGINRITVRCSKL